MTDTIRVLHVDDDPEFAELTATSLRDEDGRFDLTAVRDAGTAEDHLTTESVECIISAHDLPSQTGIDFLQAVREEFPDLPFLLFTSKGSEDVASNAISAGVTDYFQKGTGSEQFELLANRVISAVENYRKQRTLERQSDLFRRTQNLANVGAWEYNPAEGVAHFSEEIYEIYGIDSEYDPDPETDIERFYHPEDRETVRQATTKAIESGEEYDIEVRITAADGTEKWVRTRGKPEFTDGVCHRVRGTMQDITDKRRRKQELEAQNERLEEFAQIVSHDLKNPLSVARANLEMARVEYDFEQLDKIEAAIDRCNRIIEDVLTLASEGTDIRELELVSLERVASDCWETVATKDATLAIDTDRIIRADRSRLRQLLSNLMRNAVLHGGNEVTVRLGTTENGFYISDSGSGIPDAEQGEIFDSGYTTSAEGTGFGLSIVSQIVDGHGWDLELSESAAGGARFDISGVEFDD